jgi:hypothetical protein
MRYNLEWLVDQTARANEEWKHPDNTNERNRLAYLCDIMGIDVRAVQGAHRLCKKVRERIPLHDYYSLDMFERFLDLLSSDFERQGGGMPDYMGFPQLRYHRGFKKGFRHSKDRNGYRYYDFCGLMRFSPEDWTKFEKGSGFSPTPGVLYFGENRYEE